MIKKNYLQNYDDIIRAPQNPSICYKLKCLKTEFNSKSGKITTQKNPCAFCLLLNISWFGNTLTSRNRPNELIISNHNLPLEKLSPYHTYRTDLCFRFSTVQAINKSNILAHEFGSADLILFNQYMNTVFTVSGHSMICKL